MDRKVSIAVVGCGSIFHNFHRLVIEAFSDDVEIVAVADNFMAAAEETGKIYSVPAFDDVEKMLDTVKGIDILYILTHFASHHTIAQAAIARKINFFVEKPFAITLKACDDVINNAQKAGVKFQVGENFPFSPNDIVFYKVINEGLIGDVEKVWLMDPINPFALATAIHRVCQMRLCVNSPVSKVKAMTFDAHMPHSEIPPDLVGKVEAQRKGDPITDKTMHALVKFKNGVQGAFMAAPVWPWVDPKESNKVRCRHVEGSRGIVSGNLWPFNYHTLKDNNVYLNLKIDGKKQAIPVTRKARVENGKEIVEQIVVETPTPLVWDNPFKDKALDDREMSGAHELMSIVNAVRNDTDTCYNKEAKIDLEFYLAMIESDHLGAQEIDLPLNGATAWEKKMKEYE